jgi:hypothetical protein
MAALTSLIAQHSGGYLAVDPNAIAVGGQVPAGTRIVQEAHYFDGFGEKIGIGFDLFRVEHLGDDSYRVVSELSDMVFDVAGASQASGTPVIIWPWNGGSNQRFRLKQPPVNNKAWGFYLEAQHSGKVLDVASASGDRGAPLVQWDYHGGPNQLFRIFGSPIKPAHSELVLDVVDASHANGGPIVQYPLHGGPNQRFRLEQVGVPGLGNSGFRIVAEHSGKVLDVAGASHENGAKLIQWDWHGGPNQVFEIRAVAGWFRLFARYSGKFLDVAGASQDQGAQLIQWSGTGGANQRFQL